MSLRSDHSNARITLIISAPAIRSDPYQKLPSSTHQLRSSLQRHSNCYSSPSPGRVNSPFTYHHDHRHHRLIITQWRHSAPSSSQASSLPSAHSLHPPCPPPQINLSPRPHPDPRHRPQPPILYPRPPPGPHVVIPQPRHLRLRLRPRLPDYIRLEQYQFHSSPGGAAATQAPKAFARCWAQTGCTLVGGRQAGRKSSSSWVSSGGLRAATG